MKRMLKAAALVLAATVLGLLTVQGTLALWNTTASSKSQSLSTAEFTVSVKSGDGATQYLAEGAGVVDLAGLDNLVPGETRTTAIRLGNATNADSGNFRARITVGTPVSTGDLKNHLTLSIGNALGGDCTKTTTESTVDLAQEQTALFCLRTTLSATAPASLSGGKSTVSVPLSAAQL